MANSEKLLLDADTKFEHYQVIDMIYVGRPARVLFSGNRAAAQSGVPKDDNPKMLFDYNQRLLELVLSTKPKNILLIGGGAFTLPLEILKYSPKTKIDVVEQDPELEQIAMQFFGLKQDERLNIIFDDGRKYLAKCTKIYDLIIMDAFSSSVIPHALSTYEFVTLLKNRVAKGGLTAINIISAYHGLKNTLIKKQYATYKELFKHVDIFPADDTLSYWISQNFIQISTNKLRKPKYNLRLMSLPPPIINEADIIHDQ